MNEIQQALKDIVLKFLLFVKESISLKLLACIAVAVIAWTQAGQAGGVSTLIAQIITALAGLGYVATKAVQNAIVIKNGGLPQKKVLTTPKAPVVSKEAPEPFTTTTTTEPEGMIPIAFDKEAFNQEVKNKVKGMYGTDNASTRFYMARDYVFPNWYFNTKEALCAGADEVLKMAHESFTEIWGMAFEDALNYKPAKGECVPTDITSWARQQSMGHYVALLNLRNCIKWHAQVAA